MSLYLAARPSKSNIHRVRVDLLARVRFRVRLRCGVDPALTSMALRVLVGIAILAPLSRHTSKRVQYFWASRPRRP